jgi:hypothetical protein
VYEKAEDHSFMQNSDKTFGFVCFRYVRWVRVNIGEFDESNDEIRTFEAPFKGVSTRFGQRTIEKCFENPDLIFCSSFQKLRLGSIEAGSAFQNLRLGGVNFSPTT